ncbi:MAG: hypothetical protein VST68_03570, partial [Nitrospirota bacterium]|nr:hypothetical protein [Nitrospirota bacterium]
RLLPRGPHDLPRFFEIEFYRTWNSLLEIWMGYIAKNVRFLASPGYFVTDPKCSMPQAMDATMTSLVLHD